MKKIAILYLSISLAVVLTGCDVDDNPAPPQFLPPFIDHFSAQPALISTVTAGIPFDPESYLDTTIAVSANVSIPGGNPGEITVSCSLSEISSSAAVGTVTLLDNGLFPDSISGDLKYTGSLPLHIKRKESGTYLLTWQAKDRSSSVSNRPSLKIFVVNTENKIPSLSIQSMPDTVFVPVSPNVNILRMVVAVTDSNGIDDIVKVEATIVRADSTVAGTYKLYDDGGTVVYPLWSISSSDSIARDGLFSLQMPVLSNTTHPMYRDIIFRATDRAGTTSQPKTKRIYFQ